MINVRRNFLKQVLVGAGGWGLISGQVRAMQLCQTVLTLAQAEGPFYPVADQADVNWDLT